MERFKIAAIVLILFGGASGAYLIIKNSNPLININKETLEKLSNDANEIKSNPIKWAENLTADKIGDVNSKKELIDQKNINSKSALAVNLTESVAKAMFEGMKTMDQTGDNPFNNLSLDNFEDKKLAQEIIADFQDFSLQLNSAQSIGIKDVKILKDNSLEAKAKYLETAGKIVFDNSNDFYNKPHIAVENIAALGDVNGLDQLIFSYSNIFNGFLNLAVPSDFSDIHLRYLNFLKRAETFYSGIKIVKNDPIKIQLLVQLIPEIIETDLNLKQEFYQKVLDNNF